MKTKTARRRASGGAAGNGCQERGVHTASTSAHGKTSSLAGAVAGRTRQDIEQVSGQADRGGTGGVVVFRHGDLLSGGF